VLVAIEFDGKIDVTVGAGVAARERAKQREMPDAAGPQLRCVPLQAGDDLVGLYRNVRTHPLSKRHHNMARLRSAATLILPQWQRPVTFIIFLLSNSPMMKSDTFRYENHTFAKCSRNQFPIRFSDRLRSEGLSAVAAHSGCDTSRTVRERPQFS
jgi:hypothetical protein